MLHVMYLDNRVCNLNRHLEVLFNNIKPYEGINFKTKKIKRFYDEREWRFIPGDLNTKYNETDSYEYLEFDLSEIVYIKVESIDEKEELKTFLMSENKGDYLNLESIIKVKNQ